jgi:hypothetical protein
MNNISIFIVTDNDEGKLIFHELKFLETDISMAPLKKMVSNKGNQSEIGILIIHLEDTPLATILQSFQKQNVPEKWLKFVFLKHRNLKGLKLDNFHFFHLEFLQRPVRINEFLLLVEKSILTEKYKLLLKETPVWLQEKGESLENIYDTLRKKLIDEDSSSSKVFAKIINLQQKLDEETDKYQKAIEKFSGRKKRNLVLENNEQSGAILESLLPFKSSSGKDVQEQIKSLEENNRLLHETLLAAQRKIFELEKKQGTQAL